MRKKKKIKLPKRVDIKPFDEANTEGGKVNFEEFMKEYKRRQWFENPQSPRA